MEENKEMLELMKELEKLNRRQLRTGRMQCLFSLTAAVFCAIAEGKLLSALSYLIFHTIGCCIAVVRSVRVPPTAIWREQE